MGAGTHECNKLIGCLAVEPIDQEEIAADVTLAMTRPFAGQGMIVPLGAQWPIVGNERYHHFFKSRQIETTRMREAFPVWSLRKLFE